MYNRYMSIRSSVIDEISLEGLDGITLEALWTRLSDRLVVQLPFPERLCKEVWYYVRVSKEIEIYKLPKDRNKLVLFDRYETVDPILGIVVEPPVLPPVIYENHPIHDKEKNVMGSCPTYDKRQNITLEAKSMELDDVLKKWGMKLVMVADQETRRMALVGNDLCEDIELSLIQYCILERIGRARYHGEVTLGKISLQDMEIDAKSMFYHRKSLTKYKLIVKQVHYQKAGKQNTSGSLLHLPRFYVERKPKACYMTAEVVEILREKPNYMAEYDEVRKRMGVESITKKLFKTTEFQKFVRTDVILPYRSLYPDAKMSEWKRKGSDLEKTVRALQLIDPDVDVLEAWSNDDDLEPAEDSGLLDYSRLRLDRSLLSQAYQLIESAGPCGMTQTVLGKKMGQSKLCARLLCRRLHSSKLVWTMLEDMGRQRVSKYVSCKFNDSNMAEAFKHECGKMLNYLSTNKKFVPALGSNLGNNTDLSITESFQTDDLLTEEFLLANDENSNSSTRPGSPHELFDGNTKEDVQIKFVETKVNSDVKGYAVNTLDSSITDSTKKDSCGISYRLVKRANIVIQSVREHQVITDPTKLMKLIQEEEVNEGYLVKIDKKSLFRMLMKLSKDGYLKIIQAKLELVHKKRQKNLTFICECDVTINNSIIVSELEQTKMKMFTHTDIKVVKEPLIQNESDIEPRFECESITQSMNELKEFGKNTINKTLMYDAKISKKYGYQPKLVRMKILHKFLYHLIHEEIGQPLSSQEAYDYLEMQGCDVTPAIKSEISSIYTKEISWKMFIPPLPNHSGWPTGWTLMCDILLRLPLSIFLQLCNISFQLPNIDSYLDHPIRKHYLVKHLPLELRNNLTMARKYIFSVHEIMQKLCYVGLIQFGPQKLKEKDQVFVYLNQRALLYDTRSSEPGYHLTKEQDFPCYMYEFKSDADLEKYWCDFWDISVHTNLGLRNTLVGQQIILEKIPYKAILQESLKPKEPHEALEADVGYIPGDKRGAAGIDSSMFTHLKRNWHWSSVGNSTQPTYKKEDPNIRHMKLKSVSKSISFKDLPCHKKITAATLQIGSGMSVKSKRRPTVRRTNNAPVVKRLVKKDIIRNVAPRRHKRKSGYYDEVDKKALQLMSKLRVDWHPDEDKLLLVCKVGLMYLFPSWRSITVSLNVVRDILHKITHSINKTSKACQRRILYIMKNPQTERSVRLCLEEIRWLPAINKNFGPAYLKAFREISADHEDFTNRVNIHYVELITVLRRVFGGFSVNFEPFSELLPKTMEEFDQYYNIRTLTDLQENPKNYSEPTNIQDIQRSVIQSIIHSSLCCVRDKTRWNYQLYNIYKQYPEHLLRSILAKLRGTYMVSVKKNVAKSLLKTGNLPLSSAPFQLSITYENQMRSKFLLSTFHESSILLRKLLEKFDKKEEQGLFMTAINGGSATSFAELILQDAVDFDICVPEQVVVLDPRLKEDDPTYERILKRYQDLLISAGRSINKKDSDIEDSDNEENDIADEDNAIPSTSSPQKQKFDFVFDEKLISDPEEAMLTSQGRIALWMMRLQGTDIDPESKQHLHDYFVVNSSNFYATLNNRNGKVCLSEELLYKGKKTWENFFNNLRESNNIREQTKMEDEIIGFAFDDQVDKLDNILRIAKGIARYVKSKTSLGATNKEILAMFEPSILNNTNFTVVEFLNRLIKHQVILRVGICEPRYIHKFHASPWLVQTTKILRLDREKITGAKDVSQINSSKRKRKNSKSDGLRVKRQRLDSQNAEFGAEDLIQKVVDDSVNNDPTGVDVDTKLCNESLEVREGAQYLESVSEQLRIIISPWIRVDGSVNKRVLDQWLSTVLSYCLTLPAIKMKNVQKKFSFQLPYHTRQLIEILVQLKCLSLHKMAKPKITLFSKRTIARCEPATGLEDSEDIIIMPAKDAVLKFGAFVGDRIYATSFLTHIK